jgi:hypothetical protein
MSYGGAQGSGAWWEDNNLPARTTSELDRQQFDQITKQVNKKGLNSDGRWKAYQRALDILGR